MARLIWTDREIELIKEKYLSIGVSLVMYMPQKKKYQISKKARDLGIKSDPEQRKRQRKIFFEIKRFENSFIIKESGCWEWQAVVGSNGYGVHWLNRKRHIAHRFSYEKYVNKIPSGLFACHKCDNPKCVNPDHIFLGTHLENMRDMKLKKRGGKPRGEKAWNAILKEKDVLEIRASDKKNRELAKLYGVSEPAMHAVRNRKSWRHI